MTRYAALLLPLSLVLLLAPAANAQSPSGSAAKDAAPRRRATSAHVEAGGTRAAGEYLTTVGGCNDCHTTGWDQSNGRTPPSERFTGSKVGYRGPWGVTYAANLRLMVQKESENEWVRVLTTADGGEGRPPMPWMNTAHMSDRDLRAMYRYIKSLGARGERTPRAVPPGTEPTGEYINFVPVTHR
jgi:mono/diheme cytochrome c family protein